MAPAEARTIDRNIPALGSLAAWDWATLSTKVAGRLDAIEVDRGTPVARGQVLARIEPRDYELRLDQAEAALQQAEARLGLTAGASTDPFDPGQVSSVKQASAVLEEATANHARVTELAAQGIISLAEVDTAAAALKVARNRHQAAIEDVRDRLAVLAQRRVECEIARQQLADTVLAAPFDGTIQERLISPGEYLPAGAAVVTLVRLDPLRLRLEVSEREAPRVALGQTVRLMIEGDTNRPAGRLTRVSPALLEETRMLVVEADVPNPAGRLHPGMFVRAEIVVQTELPVVTVPDLAVATFAGLEKVFGIREGRAVEKRVVTGDRGDGWVEIREGVAAGDMIVLSPGNLLDGQPLEVEP